MNSIAVIGAGAWGCALAIHLARAGHGVTLWARDPASAGHRLPGHKLPPEVAVTAALPDTPQDAVLLAVPAQHLRSVAARLRPVGPFVACAKGIERGTLRLPLEILAELHPGHPAAVLGGPNFAHEVAAGLPAAAAVGPLGVQLGGAAKNVIAIAAGVVAGAGLGENARAALVTRGVAELSRLIVALGGAAHTAAGLSGLGDLLLTCTGNASRNFQAGLALGRGRSAAPDPHGPVVEGVATAPALIARARGIELPICASVAALLEGRLTVPGAIAALMRRPVRDED
jgi:glycerol-3-phosphate dehydrogenase (NAD(P)+)